MKLRKLLIIGFGAVLLLVVKQPLKLLALSFVTVFIVLSLPFGQLVAQDEDLEPIITTALAVSPDGTRIALGRSPSRCLPPETKWQDRTVAAVRILDMQGRQIDRILGPICPINDLEWNSDGTRLAISQNVFATAWIYNFDTQQFSSPRAFGGVGGPESGGVVWSYNEEYLVNFSYDIPIIYIFSGADFDLISTVRKVEQEDVTAIDLSSDNYLAIADFLPSVQIWNVQQITSPQLVIEHDLATNTLAWSPDNTVLALGIEDILLIDPFTGTVHQTLTGHTDVMLDIKWSPDGSMIASGGLDDTIRVWDPISGTELAQYPVNTRVPAFDWSSDSTKLIYGVEDEDTLVIIAGVPATTPTATPQP